MKPRPAVLAGQELEIMKIVWDRETVTVRDVYEVLREHRRIAYTTVMTTMSILEQKGFLRRTRKERAYLYRPTRRRESVVRGMVREFLDRVFNGAAEPLLVHLAEDRRISEDDLDEIRRLIRKKP